MDIDKIVKIDYELGKSLGSSNSVLLLDRLFVSKDKQALTQLKLSVQELARSKPELEKEALAGFEKLLGAQVKESVARAKRISTKE